MIYCSQDSFALSTYDYDAVVSSNMLEYSTRPTDLWILSARFTLVLCSFRCDLNAVVFADPRACLGLCEDRFGVSSAVPVYSTHLFIPLFVRVIYCSLDSLRLVYV